MSNPVKLKREFVFATYVANKFDRSKDALFVKEILHHPNGETRRNFRRIDDYVRPYYITKPDYQDHTQKKEYEHVDKLDVFYSNQANLANNVYRSLHKKPSMGYTSLYDLGASPYIYGTDITTPVLLSQEYRKTYPDLASDNTLAVMDYETDVVHGTGEIISGVLSFKDRIHIAVTEDFMGGLLGRGQELILAGLSEHLQQYLTERNITQPLISFHATAGGVVKALMKSAHQWSPDFLGFWNISFDVKKMLSALQADNIDPRFIFSDPSVPNEFKSFKWREDDAFTVTASGQRKPKHVADRWHVVTAPSSFYCICLMSTFKHVRAREQQRSTYKLDDVLHDYLKLGKLRFASVPTHLVELDWHREMQKNHRIEYMIYMAFDGISCELLNDLTKDVTQSLKAAGGISEFAKLKSNPKRLIDDIYFDLLEDNKVIGCTSKDMTDEFDSQTPTLKNWIITLPSELEYQMGNPLLNEYSGLDTNITVHAYDVDVTSAYPRSELTGNVSKSTRYLELCHINGLTVPETRAIGINLSSVTANALTLAKTCYDYPALDDLLSKFIEKNNL